MEIINKPSVLIVDDIIKNLQVLASVLWDNGYEVALAESAKQALDSISQQRPDLILLDVMMPEIDGFQLCEQLKSSSEYNDIPIIFLTAKQDTESIVKGFKIGGIDYITKPFNQEELI